jgi:hypothetical protein
MTIRNYLLAISSLAGEVADDLTLLPSFMRIVKLVPATVAQLRRRETGVAFPRQDGPPSQWEAAGGIAGRAVN